MNLGKVIREHRKKAGFTQIEFAKKVGITQTSISHIESGVRSPHMETLETIAWALSIPTTVLFLESIEPDDVSILYRKKFKLIWPAVQSLITQIFKDEHDTGE